MAAAAAPLAVASGGPSAWLAYGVPAALSAGGALIDWIAGSDDQDKAIQAALDQQRREHEWRSQEAEREREFSRERNQRYEDMYNAFVGRQREMRAQWEQRRGSSFTAANALIPGIHGLPAGFSLSPMIQASQAIHGQLAGGGMAGPVPGYPAAGGVAGPGYGSGYSMPAPGGWQQTSPQPRAPMATQPGAQAGVQLRQAQQPLMNAAGMQQAVPVDLIARRLRRGY